MLHDDIQDDFVNGNIKDISILDIHFGIHFHSFIIFIYSFICWLIDSFTLSLIFNIIPE